MLKSKGNSLLFAYMGLLMFQSKIIPYNRFREHRLILWSSENRIVFMRILIDFTAMF